MWRTSSEAPGEAFVFNCTGAAALQRNESGHCARGDVGISGEGGTVSEICESYEKAALLFLLPSSTQTISNIRFAYQQILFLEQGSTPFLTIKAADGVRNQTPSKTWGREVRRECGREG